MDVKKGRVIVQHEPGCATGENGGVDRNMTL